MAVGVAAPVIMIVVVVVGVVVVVVVVVMIVMVVVIVMGVRMPVVVAVAVIVSGMRLVAQQPGGDQVHPQPRTAIGMAWSKAMWAGWISRRMLS